MTKAQLPRLLVGATDNFPDIEYATGFRAPDPVVFLDCDAGGFLIVPEMEYGRALESCSGKVTVLTPERLKISKTGRRRMSGWILAVLKRHGIRNVQVPAGFPVMAADALRRAGIVLKVRAGTFFPERAVKSPSEIRNIREAQQAAVIAMRTVMKEMSESEITPSGYLKRRGQYLTSERLKRTIVGVLMEHNCFCRDVIAACGPQAADPHESGHGPIYSGEPVVIDIFPRHLGHGYWGDITRTFVRGPARPELKKMYLAVKAAQAAALNRIKAGVKCASVHAAAVAEFERRGFQTEQVDGRRVGFIHGTGHGVGLAVHEAPSLGVSDEILRAGNIVTVEPGLYYPGLGGIRIEDTVVVTRTGWQYLAPCEKRFEI